jgi:hypothetical protein
MNDLIGFITARLDEDERTTIAFRDGHPGPCLNYEGQSPENYSEYDTCYRHLATAEASRYRDTAFGLREVEAKRRLLAYLIGLEDKATDNNWWSLDTDLPFKLLALPYADHPDYQAEWAPGTP